MVLLALIYGSYNGKHFCTFNEEREATCAFWQVVTFNYMIA